MSADQLQKAIDCLKIKDVFQCEAVSKLTEGFEPQYFSEVMSLEYKHVVTQSKVIEVKENNSNNGDNGDKSCLFRVYIEAGARWIMSSQEESDVDAQDDNSVDVLASIEATFVAEYWLLDKPGKKALDAFALSNASYHIWPYWREYLMSQGMRMNLPKVALPAIQIAMNDPSREAATNKTDKP